MYSGTAGAFLFLASFYLKFMFFVLAATRKKIFHLIRPECFYGTPLTYGTEAVSLEQSCYKYKTKAQNSLQTFRLDSRQTHEHTVRQFKGKSSEFPHAETQRTCFFHAEAQSSRRRRGRTNEE
jgi:hypothetical protein